jgi:hypothetical protein
MNRTDAENACNALGKSLATIETSVAKFFTAKYLMQRKKNINRFS